MINSKSPQVLREREALRERSRELKNMFEGMSQNQKAANDGSQRRNHSIVEECGKHSGVHARPVGAVLTSSGRPVMLSAGSRRLPAAFTEQRITMRGMESLLQELTCTLDTLTTDFCRTTALKLPADTAAAVEDSHRQYLMARREALEGEGSMMSPAMADKFSDTKKYAEWLLQVKRARAAAADESAADEQSVADYAAEPEVPKLVTGNFIRNEVLDMHESLAKIFICGHAMCDMELNSSVMWWSSALRTRDMKAYSIRANYHARRAIKYNWKAREHLLLQASFLNHHSEKSREDLVRLQTQLATFEEKAAECEAMIATVQRQSADLMEALGAANDRRRQLQTEVLQLAHSLKLLEEEDQYPLGAELVLLLNFLRWPKELQSDVQCVLDWLRFEDVTLE